MALPVLPLATLFSQAVNCHFGNSCFDETRRMYQLEPKKNPPAPIFLLFSILTIGLPAGFPIYDVQYCQYHYSVLFKSSGTDAMAAYAIQEMDAFLLDDFRYIFGFFDATFVETKLWCRKAFKDETKRNCLSFDGPCRLSACKPDFDFLWKLSLPALYAGCRRYQSRNGNYFLACTKLCFIYLY